MVKSENVILWNMKMTAIIMLYAICIYLYVSKI
jgi:hypothetical protein